MKLKKLFGTALTYFISACIIFLSLTLLAQVISFAFFALLFLIGIGMLVYLLFRNHRWHKT